MTFLKRLRVLPALLGVAATLAALGTTIFGDLRARTAPPAAGAPAADARPDAGRLTDELAASRFAKLPVLTYQPRDGELLFAWQIQPTVAAPAPRPRDVLVLVDTTASQAGRPLQQAKHIITALTAGLTADDRVSIWALNTPATTRALTKDFQAPTSADVQAAATSLVETEYGSGAADLKGGLEKALATMAPNRSRHQVVLYLGDGESAYKPLTEDDRLAVGNRMDVNDQYFFAVPLGIKLDSHNLHGLSVLTGGAVVRVQEDLAVPGKRAEFLARLKAALDVSVVKPEKWAFGDEVGESYPTKLPPLRADRSTLVMGKIAKPLAGAVTATVNGILNGKPVVLNFNQPLPAPQVDHFFLNLMIHQWRNAPHKDAPAMLQSDRALALASTQVKLYRNEFLTQAVWAVSVDRLDEAEKLYGAALKVDPTDKEAASGSVLVAKMKAGKLTKAELEKKVAEKVGALKVDKDTTRENIRKLLQEPGAALEPPAPPGPGGVAPPAGPGAAADIIKEAAARRQIEEQRYKVLVDATIRRGRALLRADPDAAYQDLKRQRDEILSYDAIGEDARRQMVADLEAVMREVFVKGAEIKRQADAERAAIARTRQRLNEFDRLQDELARDKNRIDQFRSLMQQARYELAYQEAQLMVQEKISRGMPVPPQATASYIIGQQATHLREWRELVRLREDRFLLAMLQTEKSHIPYPDEPPVHFPPAAVWRELTGLRREAYLNSNLGTTPSATQKQLKSVIEDTEVQLKEGANINEIPLFELLQDLSKRYQVTFVIMEEYFKAEGQPNIKEEKAKLAATQLRGLKLGNFLDIILLSMNATYIVRPDYIEVTTFQKRLEEKVTRVFPVADLAIPIPQAVNQQSLQQNLSLQNATLAIFGQASLFGGGLQNIGGNFGSPFGGAGGAGGANFGNAGGGGPFGQQAGNLGNAANLGAGGGFTSFGGGNLGQFGNLGGQFGLQGGDQSGLLIQLIVETVAKGEWDPRTLTIAKVAPPKPGEGDDETPALSGPMLNSMGYYPPARALIVRGSGRYHSATSIKFPKDKIGGGMAAAPRPGDGRVVIGPATAPMPKDPANPAPKNPVAAKPPADPAPIVAATKPTMVDPKPDAVALRKQLGTDPKTMWSNAIDWTVTDPGLIVATAEFLMEFNEPAAAAEVLKGNLRKGLATDDWAHDALALALQAAPGSNPAEVERAAVSAVDLDPTGAKAYLKAAKAEANLKNHNQAFAFAKRAAEFSPGDPTPYANALAYAEFATDVKSDAVMWAADNLLKRDWSTTDGIDYHKEARGRLPKLEAKLKAAGQNTAPLARAITEQTQRDLVIELLWQGNADLDLIVAEPTGSVCSATGKRTTGGGVLKGDILEQAGDRSELYTAASAFSGTYKVKVKQAFGRPVGGGAVVKVTKFQGTPKEVVDLLDVPLNGAPVEVKLDGGSRTTLAEVAEEVVALDLRAGATGASATGNGSGLGGGFGAVGSAMSSPVATAGGPALPAVAPPTEMRMPGISANTADIRATYKLNPDRKSYSITVNPVFAGKGEIAMPKVPLLPGGEGK
jgi:tetratricopeptide (TPR) repeat protein